MEYQGPRIHWKEKVPRSAHYAETSSRNESKPRHFEAEAEAEAEATVKVALATIYDTANVLTPTQTTLAVHIVDHATKLVATLSFRNSSDAVIQEGYFTFPFPSGCSLTKFRCFIGDERVLSSKVKPTNNAVAEFEGAVHNRKMAALFAQRTPEIFTACLGNIPPKTTLRAEVSLVMLLKDKLAHPNRISTLTIPTYIAPRYGNAPPYLVNSVSKDTKHTLHVTVEVVTGEEILEILSKTHAISVETKRGPRPCQNWTQFVKAKPAQGRVQLATIKLKDPISMLDGDFVLDMVTWPRKELDAPQAWLETHPSLMDHHAVMLNIPANALLQETTEIKNSEILFLADRSGSMVDKIPSLKSAMRFFLKGIPEGRNFNIWSFGSNYSSLWPQSKLHSRESLAQAELHVENDFQSDLGCTELLPALKAIFKARSNTGSSTTDVILLTDGEVWREEDTIAFVNSARKHSKHRVRFFCLGIGPAVSHSLVEGIARSGGGYAEVVPASKQYGWEDRVVLMLKAALHNHVGPVQLEIGEDTKTGFRPWKANSFLQSPAETTSLSPFVTNRVFLLFEATGVPVHRAIIVLKTTGPAGEIVHRMKPTPSREPDLILNTLGARALLEDLERGRSWLHQKMARDEEVRREGESIACKWSLLSKWTCFVAVEEEREGGNALSNAIRDNIAAICQLDPSGWDPDLQREIGSAPRRVYLPEMNSSDSESESDDASGSDESEYIVDLAPRRQKDDPDDGPNPGSGPSSSSPSGGGSSNGRSSNPRPSGSDLSGPKRSGSRSSNPGHSQYNSRSHQTKQNSEGLYSTGLEGPEPICRNARGSTVAQEARQDSGAPRLNITTLRGIFERLRWPEVLEPGSPKESRTYWADEPEESPSGIVERLCIVSSSGSESDEQALFKLGKRPRRTSSPSRYGGRQNSSIPFYSGASLLLPASSNYQMPAPNPHAPRGYQTPSSHPCATSQGVSPHSLSPYTPQLYQSTLGDGSTIDGRNAVRKLLKYQQFDGSFRGLAKNRLEKILGEPIRSLLDEVTDDVLRSLGPSTWEKYHGSTGNDTALKSLLEASGITVAITTIAVLQSHLASYRDLWLLIVDRAEHYVTQWLVREFPNGTLVTEELLASAVQKAKNFNFRFENKPADQYSQGFGGAGLGYNQPQHDHTLSSFASDPADSYTPTSAYSSPPAVTAASPQYAYRTVSTFQSRSPPRRLSLPRRPSLPRLPSLPRRPSLPPRPDNDESGYPYSSDATGNSSRTLQVDTLQTQSRLID